VTLNATVFSGGGNGKDLFYKGTVPIYEGFFPSIT
jgi:hypothetical protein